MRTLITGGRVILPNQIAERATLVIEDGEIASIQDDFELEEGDQTIDAKDHWVAPGLIDLHIHGCGGFSTMSASAEALQGMSTFLAQHGVTAFLPTTVSADRQAIVDVLHTPPRLPETHQGAGIPGVHIEGPFINPNNLGAQPAESVRPPDLEELERWIETGQTRLITLAPEVEGAMDFIDRATSQGVEISLGHTSASYNEFIRAIDLGATQSTHTFNSMKGLHHRDPGPIGAILNDDRLYAQLIADGVHVHPAVIKFLLRTKGVMRTILISDAISATGLADGEYQLGGQLVNVSQGVARIPAGNLAGSTLTLDQALRNVIEYTGLALPEALPMATSVPAEAMGWDRKGSLHSGADADVILITADLQIERTIVAGKGVFEREG